jgi:hypothetical protein
LPVGVNRLTDPYSWRLDQVTEFRRHIEDGQQQRISDRRVFQFGRVDAGDPETTLRVEIAPRSELRYDACSRLYVARMLRNDHSDLQAMREVVNQLPSLGVSRYQPLSEEDFGDARMHAAGCTELQFLLHYMDDYEDGAPVQVRGVNVNTWILTGMHTQAKPGHWTKLWETSLWFPQAHPDHAANVDTLGGWWLQEEYFKASAQQANQYSMRTFSTWLRSGILDHTPSNTLLGGPFGLKWPVLQLTHAYWTLVQLRDGGLPPHRTQINVDIQGDLQVVLSDILWLSSRIKSSVLLFVSMRQKQFDNMPLEPVPTTARRITGR